jgi:type IV secretion system protein VirB11
MNASSERIWLDSCLAPLSRHLARAEVTDLYINRPGEIWLEVLGGGIERHDAPHLTTVLLGRLARQIAAVTAQGINREHPVLSAALPTGERIQVVMPPATRGDIAMAIRRQAVSNMRLADYRDRGAFRETPIISFQDLEEQNRRTSTPQGDVMSVLRQAVLDRRNILISGGTATGKTTFLNAMLAEIPADERLITIEDTPELRVSHENSVGLLAARSALGEASITADDLLISALRMRPDRIILGEIRGHEAATFLRAVNTGHPGSLTTIHADSPLRAIDQLALLVLQTGMRMEWDHVIAYVKRSLDLIVQLKRTAAGRTVHQILSLDRATT